MILRDEEDNEGTQLLSWVEFLSKGCENITEDLDVSIIEPDIETAPLQVKVRVMLNVLTVVSI